MLIGLFLFVTVEQMLHDETTTLSRWIQAIRERLATAAEKKGPHSPIQLVGLLLKMAFIIGFVVPPIVFLLAGVMAGGVSMWKWLLESLIGPLP